MLLGAQVQDIQRNHIQQSLSRIWTSIHREIAITANDELADYVVQITEGIGRWNLEDSIYQQSINYTLIPTIASENISNQNFGKLTTQIDELHNTNNDIFAASHDTIDTSLDPSLYL